MRRLAMLMTTAAIALGATPLAAHDMWIEPTTFTAAVGEIVGVKLRVGQDWLGDPLPRDPSLVNEFVAEDGDGRRPVVGRPGSDPAGYVRAATAGVLVVGYRSNPSVVELTPEKFAQYVTEEGLDAVAQLRARRGQTGGGRDMFSRCAKSLVRSGTAAGGGDRVLGFTLELVAERNPLTLAAGQELPVRLTYQQRPLAGALVIAMNRANPAEKLRVRTDKDGRVRLRLPRTGVWLIKAVHMIEAPAGAGADWVSYWASLTFDNHA